MSYFRVFPLFGFPTFGGMICHMILFSKCLILELPYFLAFPLFGFPTFGGMICHMILFSKFLG